jgi:hypothetical protein
MRINTQIAAHLRQQVAANFFLPILERGEFFAEVETPVTAFALIANKCAGDLPAPRQPLNAPFEFRALHVLQCRTDLSERQAELGFRRDELIALANQKIGRQ